MSNPPKDPSDMQQDDVNAILAAVGGIEDDIWAHIPYERVRRLGSGGFAEVWLANERDSMGKRPVAIKRILNGIAQDEDAQEMFRDESALMRRLNGHPNLPHFYKFYEVEGKGCAIAMEYLEGHTIADLCRLATRAERLLSEALCCYIIAEAAETLAHVHAHKREGNPEHIVHRDISPSNLFLTSTGHVKVMDFGIAIFSGADRRERTRVGPDGQRPAKGKPLYMSPEQAKGQPLDGRSDQWALGVLLVGLLTGRPVFRVAGYPPGQEEDEAVMLEVSKADGARMDAAVAKLASPLRDIVRRALSPQRADRYPSCADFAHALSEHLAATVGVYRPSHALAEVADLMAGRPSASARAPVSGARGGVSAPERSASGTRRAVPRAKSVTPPSGSGGQGLSQEALFADLSAASLRGVRPLNPNTLQERSRSVVAGPGQLDGETEANEDLDDTSSLPPREQGAVTQARRRPVRAALVVSAVLGVALTGAVLLGLRGGSASAGAQDAQLGLALPAGGEKPAASGAQASPGSPNGSDQAPSTGLAEAMQPSATSTGAAPVGPPPSEARAALPTMAEPQPAVVEPPQPPAAPASARRRLKGGQRSSTGVTTAPALQVEPAVGAELSTSSLEQASSGAAVASVAPAPVVTKRAPAAPALKGKGLLLPAKLLSHADPAAPGPFAVEVTEDVEVDGEVYVPRGSQVQCSVTGVEGARVLATCDSLAMSERTVGVSGVAWGSDKRPGMRGTLEQAQRLPKGTRIFVFIQSAF